MSDDVSSKQDRRLASVLAVDICAFAAKAEADEATAVEITKKVEATVRSRSAAAGGRLFHSAGDGFMAEFPAAQACLIAVDAIRTKIAEIAGSEAWPDLQIRMGIHVGDIIPQSDGDAMGHGVNLAARLQQAAKPGGILATESFVNALPADGRARFGRVGLRELKSLSQRHAVFALDEASASDGRISFRSILMGAAAAFLIAVTGVGIATQFVEKSDVANVANPVSVSVIDRRAIRVATEPLVLANRPIEDAISALIDTQDFTKAREQLLQELDDRREFLTSYQQVDLLHQAASLANNRDVSEAQKLYRQILSINDDDWLASWQLAQIYLIRSEREEAKRLVNLALEASGLTRDQRLRLEIDQARIENRDFGESAERFEQIAATARQLDYDAVETLATFFMRNYRSTDQSLNNEFKTRSQRLQDVAVFEALLENAEARSDYLQLALIYNGLRNAHLDLDEQEKAEDYQTKVIRLALALDQPTGIISNLINLSKAKTDSGDFEAAYVSRLVTERIARQADLVFLVKHTKYENDRLEAALNGQLLPCEGVEAAYQEMKGMYPGLSRYGKPTFNCRT